MVAYENVLKSEFHIGLCSLNLDKKDRMKIYKNKYSPLMFKTEINQQFKNSIYLIDQILCCR